ncbi:MAG: hypothetical protein HYY65_07980 [Candidatus Tectomicrobia bacterium]|uniref:Uncharacterized protein n=1 Tax=Tectimicrobiota bacterium TaxID=2528274 RepID=A0A932M0L4_UNCTE|nr:hypothetical protein [Candidatus Tectomicrobia bacterium]
MIERFNFFDIYGYLLPGLAFLGLMWLPFGLTVGYWPPAEWGSALVALVLGYLAGHLIFGLAERAIPPKMRDTQGELRFPSDILLDDGNDNFSPELKSRLVDRILIRFGIDITDAGNPEPEVRGKRRKDAFFLCRSAVKQKEAASYAEQMQGMYVLMQSLTVVCLLAAVYHFGWALAMFVPVSLLDGTLYLIAAGTVLAALWHDSGKLFWLIPILFFFLGGWLGTGNVIGYEMFSVLLGICFTLLFIALRCHTAYRTFAWSFAETVYRDFCGL